LASDRESAIILLEASYEGMFWVYRGQERRKIIGFPTERISFWVNIIFESFAVYLNIA